MAESSRKPAPSAVRVQVLFPEGDAARFGSYCRLKGFKKSTLITRLVREHLDRESFTPMGEGRQP